MLWHPVVKKHIFYFGHKNNFTITGKRKRRPLSAKQSYRSLSKAVRDQVRKCRGQTLAAFFCYKRYKKHTIILSSLLSPLQGSCQAGLLMVNAVCASSPASELQLSPACTSSESPAEGKALLSGCPPSIAGASERKSTPVQ